MEPTTIYLKDYKPAAFSIPNIDLVVKIYDDRTIVHSNLKVEKKKSQAANLELNGENLKLVSIRMNGIELKSSDYQLSSDKLVILNVRDSHFILDIENEIDPAHNTSCEGFYRSGDQLCTQCEPEGFRKITYFIDRPDNMARFSTRMEADIAKFPYLLSNGNRISSGMLESGRHFVQWEDPFPKPSYLFAMVAGDFDIARDFFTTKSGRKVELEIYVDKGNLFKTPHAMDSLKKAMKWDEENFGLEYDLDLYMIVAVDSFNMGAMENKGLNIFNSTFVLADEKSATDHDFQNIEGVIGHEYFHNWTGNRVTCRDWFQLTLKEGLTVFRDQEFSSDMLSRAVKRIEDVRLLKEMQFAEDAGPLSHPIRPSSYIEINNFYTRTVYEKGAEVIRMIETLIGKEIFRLGMDKYFELYDGKAVTTEDFVYAMELASKKDLSQFKNWYSRPGTPQLIIKSNFQAGILKLEIEQKYPPTTLKIPEGNILHIPFKIGFLNANSVQEETLELKSMKETFQFNLAEKPILSLNRGFSAPVLVDYSYELSDLYELMGKDNDSYSKFEATQRIYDYLLKSELTFKKTNGSLNVSLSDEFIKAFDQLLNDQKIDPAFKSYLLELPSENALAQELITPDFDLIHEVRKHLKHKIGKTFFNWFKSTHEKYSQSTQFALTPEAYGGRALKNQCLSYLVASGEGQSQLDSHYHKSSNMTEEIAALIEYVSLGVPLTHSSVKGFYDKWQKDSLVMLKWFATIAAYSPKSMALNRIKELETDRLFLSKVPNYIRSLYLQFAKNNLNAFHDLSGEGYSFLAERIKVIDGINPQLASRSATAFSLINKLDPDRKKLMNQALRGIMETKPSKDTYEVLSKYLAQ
jgi:aminopeptidase N